MTNDCYFNCQQIQKALMYPSATGAFRPMKVMAGILEEVDEEVDEDMNEEVDEVVDEEVDGIVEEDMNEMMVALLIPARVSVSTARNMAT